MMKEQKLFDIVVDSITQKLSVCSVKCIVIRLGLFFLVLPVVLVYLCTLLFCDTYSVVLFRYSLIISILFTPLFIIVLLGFVKRTRELEEQLLKEKEKSKQKDIMLFEQARFVLMGEMMANISHQWKQPLNTINLAILTAKTSTKSDAELEKYFDIMEDNVTYLATTIDDFISFFDKKTYTKMRELDLIIKEIRSIIDAHIKNKYITLTIEVEANNGEVLIASSISQVVLNLLNNAKDAFDDKMEEKTINLKFTTLYDGLKIECCDNGGGIPLEIQDKIFDPYFTTKEKYQGTGIGLYMSKQIIEQIFNGSIELSNSCSMGDACNTNTCFKMILPYSKNCTLKEVKQ